MITLTLVGAILLALSVRAVRTDIADRRVELRTEIAALRGEVRTEIATLGGEVSTEIAAIRSDLALRSEVADLRADLRDLSRRWDRFFIWLAGTQVTTLLAVIGGLVGILYR